MNCREGDLAIVVRSKAGNEGKIVRCIRYVGAAPGLNRTDCWLIDRAMPRMWPDGGRASPVPYYYDAWLRPIRDTDPADVERAEDIAHA